MENNILKLNNISFGYSSNSRQVDEFSFQLSRGELVGIIGPNGAGKSTILKIAAGIISPDSGIVLLSGKNIKSIPRKDIALEMGYLPQHINIVPGYTVEQVVTMGRFCHLSGFGFIGPSDLAIVEKAMTEAGICQFRNRPIECLSGGEQQRALLGSVLAQEPEVLLLDEPTTGLDLHHQSTFFSLLAKQAQAGKAVMVVTHDLNLASKFCDKLILMDKGKLIISGTASDVITPEYISQVYHKDIIITSHPIDNCPVVLI